jgi:predicted transcriptional regulator
MPRACEHLRCRTSLLSCWSDLPERFLLARLHMKALVEQDSKEAILHVLKNLPNEIDEIYDQAMERIERQPNKELAKRVLSWIIHASRPLSVEELRHALAVSPNMTEINPDALVFKSKLTSVCAGLVVIDKEQQIIRLAREWNSH